MRLVREQSPLPEYLSPGSAPPAVQPADAISSMLSPSLLTSKADAVDGLYQLTQAHGVIDAIGIEQVQAFLAEVFADA
jgi:hypothetical protein